MEHSIQSALYIDFGRPIPENLRLKMILAGIVVDIIEPEQVESYFFCSTPDFLLVSVDEQNVDTFIQWDRNFQQNLADEVPVKILIASESTPKIKAHYFDLCYDLMHLWEQNDSFLVKKMETELVLKSNLGSPELFVQSMQNDPFWYRCENYSELIDAASEKNPDCPYHKLARIKSIAQKEGLGAVAVPIRNLLIQEPHFLPAMDFFAELLVKEDSFSDALVWLEEMEETSPPTESRLLLKSQCLRELGRYEESKQTLFRLLQSNPDNSAALEGLGKIMLKVDALELAKNFFLRVLDPIRVASRLNTEAVLCKKSGNILKSIRLCEMAAQMVDSPALRKKVLMNLATAYSERGDPRADTTFKMAQGL